MQPWIFVAALITADAISPADGSPQVTFGKPVASVETRPSAPSATLKLAVEAHNALQWPVDSVMMGLIYAKDEASMAAVKDPSALYAATARVPEGVGVLVRRVPVDLAPQGAGMATLTKQLPLGMQPTTFVTHVLGYTLADTNVANLFDLLGTSAAADEWAAVAVFDLETDVVGRRAARARWEHHGTLTADLAAALLFPVEAKPSQTDAFRRVFAVRGLGVLGGPVAQKALQTWRKSPDIGRYDSPLQVLRVGKVAGSRFETPLAFAVPDSAQTMADVTDAALEDLRELDKLPGPAAARDVLPPGDALPTGGLSPVVSEPDPLWYTQPTAWAFLLTGLALGGGAAVALRRAGRRGVV